MTRKKKQPSFEPLFTPLRTSPPNDGHSWLRREVARVIEEVDPNALGERGYSDGDLLDILRRLLSDRDHRGTSHDADAPQTD